MPGKLCDSADAMGPICLQMLCIIGLKGSLPEIREVADAHEGSGLPFVGDRVLLLCRRQASAVNSGILAAVMPTSMSDMMDPLRCCATIKLPIQVRRAVIAHGNEKTHKGTGPQPGIRKPWRLLLLGGQCSHLFRPEAGV